MNVAHLLDERAAVSGGEPALLHGEQILTFAGLARAAERAALQLRTAGVEPPSEALKARPRVTGNRIVSKYPGVTAQ